MENKSWLFRLCPFPSTLPEALPEVWPGWGVAWPLPSFISWINSQGEIFGKGELHPPPKRALVAASSMLLACPGGPGQVVEGTVKRPSVRKPEASLSRSWIRLERFCYTVAKTALPLVSLQCHDKLLSIFFFHQSISLEYPESFLLFLPRSGDNHGPSHALGMRPFSHQSSRPFLPPILESLTNPHPGTQMERSACLSQEPSVLGYIGPRLRER